MNNQTKSLASSLEPVFEGFRRITRAEQAAYLNFFDLLINRQRNARTRGQLARFKVKLEREIKFNEESTDLPKSA